MPPTTTNIYAIIGASVVGVICAFSAILYEHLNHEKERKRVAKNLKKLEQELTDVRRELHTLIGGKTEGRIKRRTRNQSYTSTTNTDDYLSATDLESSDQEFYDLTEIDSNDTYQILCERVDSLPDDATYETIQELLNELESHTNPELAWRIARCRHRLALQTDDVERKVSELTAGIERCQMALAAGYDDADLYKFAAILIGVRTNHRSMREKLNDGVEFRRYLDKALEKKPNDLVLLHMMASYAYAIAELKWYERKVMAAYDSEAAQLTYANALDYCQRADKKEGKAWKENRLLMAKCLIALDRAQEAVEALEEAAAATELSVDPKIDEEINKLLSQHRTEP